MKKLTFFLFVLSVFFLNSCSEEETKETVLFAVPKIKSLLDIRSNISISSAQQTNSDGKIYVAENYLFYIAQEEGIHVFNNQNPINTQNIAFINLEGVHDIAVKGNYLYADNFVDLVVFDISNVNNITLVKTVPNVISFYPTYPNEAIYYDYSVYPNENQIITGYTLEYREKPNEEYLAYMNDAFAELASANLNSVGTGGSYAKFQINEDALYTLDSYKLNVFNISNPINTYFDKDIYMNLWINGGQFETLFKQKEFLFVGATNGMYIVDATDEFNPYFVSGFSHATACDPVVVQGNTAYITIRGGNSCGAIEDQVNVIDFTNVSNPTLLSTTLLEQPYGLGVFGDRLFVCHDNKLAVFDASNSQNLILKNIYSYPVKDVIPLYSHLIAVGENKIYQYNYGTNFTLELISVLNL